MKIYISAPLKQRNKELKTFIKAISDIEKEEHDIIDLYKNEKYPIEEDVEYFVKLFNEAEKAIRNVDVVIVDVTFPSSRLGFEMARALDEKKVVIAMSNSEIEAPRAAPVAGNLSRYYKNISYNSKTILSLLKAAIEEAKEKIDTKFILIISPEIDNYLEWAADFKRMHKAQIVRNAIDKEMERDTDYKQFLKQKD